MQMRTARWQHSQRLPVLVYTALISVWDFILVDITDLYYYPDAVLPVHILSSVATAKDTS